MKKIFIVFVFCLVVGFVSAENQPIVSLEDAWLSIEPEIEAFVNAQPKHNILIRQFERAALKMPMDYERGQDFPYWFKYIRWMWLVREHPKEWEKLQKKYIGCPVYGDCEP